VKTPIDLYSKAPPVTIWLFTPAFGVAFWAVLFHVVSAISHVR
jgi:hypothetical protein